jgi:hypothetical protein
MRTLSTALATTALAIFTGAPALSWEFGISESGDVFWTIATDLTGESKLAFFCSQALPGAVLTQFAIEQPGPSSVVPVELGFEVADRTYGPISANAESVDGDLVVSSNGDSTMIGEAARAVYAQDGNIMLNYYESVWRFEGAAYSDSFGAMLDACG